MSKVEAPVTQTKLFLPPWTQGSHPPLTNKLPVHCFFFFKSSKPEAQKGVNMSFSLTD